MYLRIEHTTRYRYARPVEFAPHRFRLLPRSAPDLRILRASVTLSPEAAVRWRLDAEENPVGSSMIIGSSDELLVESRIVLERTVTNPFDFLLEDRALHLPVAYTDRELPHLIPYLGVRETRHSVLKNWIARSLPEGEGGSPTLQGLTSLNAAISADFRYVPRHEHGVQSASETISLGSGTCRDFALLLMESARFLGIAARYVGGYLCSEPGSLTPHHHTHGWCELFLPGAGWTGFDPTSGILASSHHVPVAVAVTAGEIPPVDGAYLGSASDFIGQEVTINAVELSPWEEP
jgi:transglutaminase-like putative cysteine protease